jgi:hypothetical protein
MIRRLFFVAVLAVMVLVGEDLLTGKWSMVMDTPGGERRAAPVLALDGETVTGKWDKSDVKGTFKDGQLELDFPLESGEAGYKANFKVSAKLEAGVLKGTWKFSEYSGKLEGKRE